MAKFLGLGYPIVDNSAAGYFQQITDIDTIKADMLQLLLTNPGERVFLPQFGTPLRTLIFEQADAITIAAANSMIQNSLKIWEPRVSIQQVNISIDGADAGSSYDAGKVLLIQILFIDPQQIQKVQQLDIQVPLAGGITNTQPLLGSDNQTLPGGSTSTLNTQPVTGSI